MQRITLTIDDDLLAGVGRRCEGRGYDRGPSIVPDALRTVNGVARSSQGTALDGFSVTGMAFAARWTATNPIPVRAVVSGTLDRLGTLDPTDGGDSRRLSLTGTFSATKSSGIRRTHRRAPHPRRTF